MSVNRRRHRPHRKPYQVQAYEPVPQATVVQDRAAQQHPKLPDNIRAEGARMRAWTVETGPIYY